MDPVTLERRGAAAVLTIDRQERRNAIDGPTAELIAAAYDRFVENDEARVLVVTGAGGVSFCAGADLKAIESFASRMDDPRGPLGISRVISPKPTIAAISGWCLAGGLELGRWCGLRSATGGRRLASPSADGACRSWTAAPSGSRASSGSAARPTSFPRGGSSTPRRPPPL